MSRKLALCFTLMLCIARTSQAADPPVAVSPGHASTLALIEDRCPTFSWGEVDGAVSYELVAYRLGEEGEDATPVLRQTIDGSALGWTPSLDRCLKRGGQYAWTVRAAGKTGPSAWSAPSLFEVSSGPSEAEFEDALQVVRQYLEDAEASVLVEHGTIASSTVQQAGSISSAPQVVDPPALLAVMGGDSDLQVNGSAVVTVETFSLALCGARGLRYLDQGDGTVLDCNTGLIWLKDASCDFLSGTTPDGRATWQGAKDAAAALKSGMCGLTDGSVWTDWRQPTISEFCSQGAVRGLCPPANASNSLINRSLPGAPLVSNAAGTGLWSEGDPFIGVQSSFYWSATDFQGIDAWYVSLLDGGVDTFEESDQYYVWPVRGGQ